MGVIGRENQTHRQNDKTTNSGDMTFNLREENTTKR